MTGKGHRITTFAFVFGTTGSILAAGMSFLASTFPDSSEYLIFGNKRNRYHRRYTHWFVIWLFLALVCFSRSGWIIPRLSNLVNGIDAHRDLWSCVGFWFTGCFLHVLEDAFCGKVPFLRAWKREIGFHFFHMSKKIGEMSAGEKTFTFFVIVLALAAWILRDIRVMGLANFWRSL